MARARRRSIADVNIGEPDLAAPSDEDVVRWLAYDEILRGETPETPFDVSRRSITEVPEGLTLRLFVARDRDGTFAGEARLVTRQPREVPPISQAQISVRPDRRRAGLGTALLRRLLDAIGRQPDTRIMAWCTSGVPSGADFARHVGASPTHVHYSSRLRIADVDTAQIATWVEDGARRGGDYSMVILDGAYPEDVIAAVLPLYHTVATVPRGSARLGPLPLSLERIRRREAAGMGDRRWSLGALHRATGTLVAITELLFRSDRRDLAEQANTAVLPAHRGRGLATWLKAAMLARVCAERPDVQEIRTANFADNAAMLAINRRLGFAPVVTATAWQVSVARAHSRLQEGVSA